MIYIANQLERLFEELKRRLKVMEQLQRGEGSGKDHLCYLEGAKR